MSYTIEELGKKYDALSEKVAKQEVQYAVINTKLTAILWLLAALGAAVIGVLVKYLLNF